jgi:hypothetical protein
MPGKRIRGRPILGRFPTRGAIGGDRAGDAGIGHMLERPGAPRRPLRRRVSEREPTNWGRAAHMARPRFGGNCMGEYLDESTEMSKKQASS